MWGRVLVAAAALAAASADLPPALLMTRVEVRNATARGAVCSSGRPAAYYYRNCSANWDRKPGCENALGGAACNHGTRVTWSRREPPPVRSIRLLARQSLR